MQMEIKKGEEKMEDKEFTAFFEGIESGRFREEVRKYATAEKFTENYELNEWVDTSDVAELGMIRIQDTNWYPTKKHVDYSKIPSEKLNDLIAFIEAGNPIPPIIVEKTLLSDLETTKDDTYDRDGFFVRDGIHRISAYDHLGLEYIPAIVYQLDSEDIYRDFDNSLSMSEFLDIDFGNFFQKTVLFSESVTQSVEDTVQLLSGGHFFSENPDHILGTAHQEKNAFGREVMRVRGSLEDAVKRIEADATEIPSIPDDLLDTLIKPTISKLLDDEKAQANVEKVLKKSRKKRSSTMAVSASADDYELLPFDEVLQTYNDDLSEEEIKAWIWYKRKTNGFNDESVLLDENNGWSKYIIPFHQQDKHIEQWMEDGVICYQKGDYIPSVLYYAENIYERQEDLLSGRKDIVEKFGPQQYDRQWEGLEAVKPALLTLTDPIENKRLVIKAISDFAKEIKIDGLEGGTIFKRRKSKYHEPVAHPFNLREAFVHWLQLYPKEDFKRSNAYEIEKVYLDNKNPGKKYNEEEQLRIRQNAKEEGDKLFGIFLAEALTTKDQQHIEDLWNSLYNGYVSINYFKIPVGFNCSATFKNKPLFVRPAQREGIGFLSVHGSGCIAYDVGVGKTMTGILSIAQAMESGMCKRPLIIVPSATYTNWLAEIQGVLNKKGEVQLSGVLPQYPVNGLYNLGEKYFVQLQDDEGNIQPVGENTITVITYDGMKKLGFNEETWGEIGGDLYAILSQGGRASAREQSALNQRTREMMGQSLEGSMINIEDLGFDYLLIDEAHGMKKVFTQVKGELKAGNKKHSKTQYQINAGKPSVTALKGFILCQYILRKNNNKNVVLLTATPFSNSPLEIYSMLSLIGFHRLAESNISGLADFFNHFIRTKMMLTINAKMQPERKEVVMGFNNLIALQKIIFRFIDYKSGEDANIQRPNKWVLPMTHKKVDGIMVPLPKDEQISTNLPMTAKQRDLSAQLEQYILGEIDYEDFCANPSGIEEESEDENQGTVLKEENLSEEEKEGVRVLRGLSLARQIAFSPYLLSCYKFDSKNLTGKAFVDSSPKLQYTMGDILTVKEYHEAKGEEMSGQVIYSNGGVDFFPLIKEYLVQFLGFAEAEVGIISGKVTPRQREITQQKFLTGQVKIVIGSQAIREGINLQNRASVLYNLWLDWTRANLIQLDGRIERFGNIHRDIRSVMPLVEDSVDMAIFQKLEEKTSRHNEIWHRDGKGNTLDLDQFNPADLKMGLITNPKVLAEIMLMEEREIILDDVTRLRSQLSELNEIVAARADYRSNIGFIEDRVMQYKPPREGQPPRKQETIFKIYREYLEDEDTTVTNRDNVYYDTARSAYNLIKRATERILEPRGLDIDFNQDDVMKRIQDEIDDTNHMLEEKTGEEALNLLTRKIIKDRMESGYEPKSVAERVKEFASLNEQLLSKRMVYAKTPAEVKARKKRIAETEELDNSETLLIEMEALLAATEETAALMEEMDQLMKQAA